MIDSSEIGNVWTYQSGKFNHRNKSAARVCHNSNLFVAMIVLSTIDLTKRLSLRGVHLPKESIDPRHKRFQILFKNALFVT